MATSMPVSTERTSVSSTTASAFAGSYDDLLAKDDGTIKKLLNSISAKLSQDELNGMNKLVSVDKKDPKDVAKDWLKKQGLIK